MSQKVPEVVSKGGQTLSGRLDFQSFCTPSKGSDPVLKPPAGILVAEDHPVMLDVIRYNLHRAGFEVVTARDGAEAIFHLQGQSFDVVLLDNQMPNMSGIEVCQHPVRQQRHPQTPFIMCSAKGLEIDDATVKRLNLHSMIFKPFSPRDLVATVKAAVEQTVVAE